MLQSYSRLFGLVEEQRVCKQPVSYYETGHATLPILPLTDEVSCTDSLEGIVAEIR